MDIYAGIAVMNDGTTQITSGTLAECVEWADNLVAGEQVDSITIKAVPAK